MPPPPRLTRHFPAKMTDAWYRQLRAFAADAGLTEGEALSFVFENLSGLLDDATLMHRLAAFKDRLPPAD